MKHLRDETSGKTRKDQVADVLRAWVLKQTRDIGSAGTHDYARHVWRAGQNHLEEYRSSASSSETFDELNLAIAQRSLDLAYELYTLQRRIK